MHTRARRGETRETTWIVVADSGRARLFERQRHARHLSELDAFVNPAGHSDDTDLRSDERGRFYGKGERNQAHAAASSGEPVEHDNAMFARALAQHLDQGRNARRYQKLCLIAAPKFLGLIRGQLHKEVQKMVVEALPKDVSSLSLPQIETYIKDKF